MGVASAQAQLSLHAPDIELKRLDMHPRASKLRETGTVVYGVVDLGLATGAEKPEGGCTTPGKPSRVTGFRPSLIGVRSAEMLGGGWQAISRLEHGLNAGAGTSSNNCGLLFDRALTVGFAHRHWGRLLMGRADHPAYGVALQADPWSGSGAVSAGDGRLYPRPVNSDGSALAGSLYRVRAPQALTYTSPDHQPWWVHLQASVSREGSTPNDQRLDEGEREVGAALHFQRGAWHAAVAYQRWNRNTEAWPVSVSHHFLTWTGHVGLVSGRLATGRYRNLQLGATIRDPGGARPGEWRIGLNAHHDAGGPRSWKLGAGRVWPLSVHTQLEVGAGLGARGSEGSKLSAGIGLRHRFSW